MTRPRRFEARDLDDPLDEREIVTTGAHNTAVRWVRGARFVRTWQGSTALHRQIAGQPMPRDHVEMDARHFLDFVSFVIRTAPPEFLAELERARKPETDDG
jgi:hypothetical protein